MNPKAATARRLQADPAGRAIEEAQQRIAAKLAAPCWLCQGLGGVAVHQRWSAERGKPLWTAHAPGSTLHPVYSCPACTAPRASQAATATNGVGCDHGAGAGQNKPAAALSGGQILVDTGDLAEVLLVASGLVMAGTARGAVDRLNAVLTEAIQEADQ